MKRNLIPVLAAAAIALQACDHSDQIGSALVQDESEVVIISDFTLASQTIPNTTIQSRTTTQVLGSIDAKGYGKFSSDFVTQFMPTMRVDTDGVTAAEIDSVKLMMAIPLDSFVGDSIVPMGLEVYRLNRQLPYPIYSDFDPEGYYDPTPIAKKIYTYSRMAETDSVKEMTYRPLDVDLPLSLGRELFQLYVDDPSIYQLPSTFAEHFPGLYVRNSFGSGRVVNIGATVIRLYYHTTSTDDDGTTSITRKTGSYYAVTPEIVTNNNIDYTIDPALQAQIDAGESIIVAPAGTAVEIQFPVKDIIDQFNANGGDLSVINSLTMKIPASVVTNDYDISVPQYLLMVPSSQKDEFFAKNQITDNVTSFYATYNSTYNCYTFSSLRPYLLSMLEKEEITPDDYTFTLTPVILTTEQSGSYSSVAYISSITPYVGPPVMTHLHPEDATITLTFSKQTIN